MAYLPFLPLTISALRVRFVHSFHLLGHSFIDQTQHLHHVLPPRELPKSALLIDGALLCVPIIGVFSQPGPRLLESHHDRPAPYSSCLGTPLIHLVSLGRLHQLLIPLIHELLARRSSPAHAEPSYRDSTTFSRIPRSSCPPLPAPLRRRPESRPSI